MKKPPLFAEKRQKILDFIMAFKAEHDGNPPTRARIPEQFQTSTSVINNDLKFLVAIGKIKSWERGSRLIEVVGGTWNPPAVSVKE